MSNLKRKRSLSSITTSPPSSSRKDSHPNPHTHPHPQSHSISPSTSPSPFPDENRPPRRRRRRHGTNTIYHSTSRPHKYLTQPRSSARDLPHPSAASWGRRSHRVPSFLVASSDDNPSPTSSSSSSSDADNDDSPNLSPSENEDDAQQHPTPRRPRTTQIPAAPPAPLPASDLLKALHAYASDFYAALGRQRRRRRQGDVDDASAGTESGGSAEGRHIRSPIDEEESGSNPSLKSMDETALLALGILLEEEVRRVMSSPAATPPGAAAETDVQRLRGAAGVFMEEVEPAPSTPSSASTSPPEQDDANEEDVAGA